VIVAVIAAVFPEPAALIPAFELPLDAPPVTRFAFAEEPAPGTEVLLDDAPPSFSP
jgi:hypothetical protein